MKAPAVWGAQPASERGGRASAQDQPSDITEEAGADLKSHADENR